MKAIPFSFRKKKQEKQASIAKEQSIEATKTSSSAPAEVAEPETPLEPELAVVEMESHHDKDLRLFVDDNDGKKEDMVCAQCVLL